VLYQARPPLLLALMTSFTPMIIRRTVVNGSRIFEEYKVRLLVFDDFEQISLCIWFLTICREVQALIDGRLTLGTCEGMIVRTKVLKGVGLTGFIGRFVEDAMISVRIAWPAIY
jgi:hypothetical protein